MPKSGKSTLAKKLSEELGIVRIKISHMLREYASNAFSLLS
jgi:adenylate kinase family enzyme